MKAFKALPAASRAATVSAGLGWIKAYAGSGEFAAAYAAWREKERPEPPAPRPAADEQTKKMKADMEKNIAEMRKGMAAMDAETQKSHGRRRSRRCAPRWSAWKATRSRRSPCARRRRWRPRKTRNARRKSCGNGSGAIPPIRGR